jgi:MFS family permease
MAFACGVTVVDVYYNQPMLGIMESTFPGHLSITGLVPTATQFGYAVGLLLLVSLGDRIEQRSLVLFHVATLAVSLAASAMAPGTWALVLASTAVGITTTVAQQIVPFAAELADHLGMGWAWGFIGVGTVASSEVRRLSASAGEDRWLVGIAVQSQHRECHYRQRNEPEGASQRRVATTASADFCSSGGSPGNWPSLR